MINRSVSTGTGTHKLAKPVEQRLHTRTEAALVVPASPRKPNPAQAMYKRSQQKTQSRSAGWQWQKRRRGYATAVAFYDEAGPGCLPPAIARALHSDHGIPYSDLRKMTTSEAAELLKRMRQDPKRAGGREQHTRVARELQETRKPREAAK